MEELIKQYGYLILLLGTLAEGETILVMAGFLAHRGYLELQWVILTAFIGTLAIDQFFYYLGYFRGVPFLERRPRWKVKYGRALELLNRHQTVVVLSFRFLYGLRTVTPFVIGLSKVKPVRFLLFNALGAFLWALTLGLLGYSLGEVFETFLGRIRRYEAWVLVGIAASGLLVWILHRARNRAKR